MGIYFTVIAITMLSHQTTSSMDAVANYHSYGKLFFDRSLRDIFVLSWITGIYFSVCFFFLGMAISVIYKVYSSKADKFYYWDLTGAACGCVVGSLMMNGFDFYPIAIFLSALCFAAAFFLKGRYPYSRFSRTSSLVFLFLSILVMTFYSRGNVFSNPRSGGLRELWSGWNVYSRVALMEEKLKDGLKYTFFIDNGIGLAHLEPFDRDHPFDHKLFDEFTATSLGFLIGQPKDILILMAGAGKDMLDAYSYSAGQADITGIELNPLIVDKAVSLPEFHLKDFFALDNVHMIVQEGRSFLEGSRKPYDTVIFSWSGSPINNYLGISANTSQYLYTKEAFKRVLQILKPDGTIVIVNGNKLRTIAVFRKAFAELGINDITDHFALVAEKENLEDEDVFKEMLTPVDTAYLIVKRSKFTPEDSGRLLGNARAMGLDAVYLPGHPPAEKSNLQRFIFKVLNDILTAKDISAVLERLSLDLKFNLTLITDDKPFIGNHFYINSLFDRDFWDFLKTNLSGLHNKHYSFHLYMMGFIVSILILVIAAMAVTFAVNRHEIRLAGDWPFFVYFSAIGFAFMLVEISLLNQFVLYLANPIYALSVILAGLLFSLGLGSYLSEGMLKRMNLRLKSMAGICVVLLTASYFLVPRLVGGTLSWPIAVKFVFVFCCIVPLGMFLGILFPQGLKRLDRYNSRLVPLAWSLNGYMSVIGSAISVYLSTMVGFGCFLLIAAGIYFSLLFLNLPDRPVE